MLLCDLKERSSSLIQTGDSRFIHQLNLLSTDQSREGISASPVVIIHFQIQVIHSYRCLDPSPTAPLDTATWLFGWMRKGQWTPDLYISLSLSFWPETFSSANVVRKGTMAALCGWHGAWEAKNISHYLCWSATCSPVHVGISDRIHRTQDFPKMRTEGQAHHLSNPVLPPDWKTQHFPVTGVGKPMCPNLAFHSSSY